MYSVYYIQKLALSPHKNRAVNFNAFHKIIMNNHT